MPVRGLYEIVTEAHWQGLLAVAAKTQELDYPRLDCSRFRQFIIHPCCMISTAMHASIITTTAIRKRTAIPAEAQLPTRDGTDLRLPLHLAGNRRWAAVCMIAEQVLCEPAPDRASRAAACGQSARSIIQGLLYTHACGQTSFSRLHKCRRPGATPTLHAPFAVRRPPPSPPSTRRWRAHQPGLYSP